MKTKTLAELVRELRGALEYYYHAQPHGHWSLVEEILDALEAALARPAAGAVGRLVEHLNANADDFNRWPMEMKSLIAAVEAERAGEREVKLDVVGTSELVFGAGKWSAYRLVGPHALCIRAALGLVDADTGTSLSLAIRRLDPQGPRAKRPWRLPSGMLMCPACEIKQAALSAACRNDECRQYSQTWGDPRDLPSGEEVGG